MDLKSNDLERKSYTYYSKELANRFSTAELMELLGISYPTARRYKRGESDIRKAEKAYLMLFLEQRIMPESWPRNITFECDDKMHLSKYSLTWGQIEHYSWMCERWGDSLRNVEVMKHYVDDVIETMSEIQQAKAMELKRIMIECVSTGKPYDIFKKEA